MRSFLRADAPPVLSSLRAAAPCDRPQFPRAPRTHISSPRTDARGQLSPL